MSFDRKFDSYFEDSKRSAYLGHETWWNAFQMTGKMYLQTGLVCWFLHSAAFSLLMILFGGKPFRILISYFATSLFNFHFPSWEVIGDWWHVGGLQAILWAAISAPVWLLFPWMIAFFQRRAERQAGPKWIRGARAIEPDELNEQLVQNKEETHLTIGECHLPVKAETSHVLVVGRTGVGKTILLKEIIDQLVRDPNARGILYDFKGDIIENYYDPERDLLFNPTDTRTIAFNIFSQIELTTDIDAIVNALIPEGQGKENFFNQAARDVLMSIFHHLWQQNRRTNADIWQMLIMPTPELSKILAATPGGERGAAVLGKGDTPQGEGVKGTLMLYTAGFGLMKNMKDSDFNIARWLSEKKGGWIFVSNYARISETIKPQLTLLLDLFSRSLLSMPDDRNRRVYLIIDELPTLGRLGSLPNLLALARSKGGSVWLGTQSISQLRKVYGDHDTDTIVNNCGTTCLFRIEDPHSTDYFSKKLGDQDVEEMDRSLSMGPEDGRDGETLMPRQRTRKLVMASELANLPERQLYLKLPGYDVTKTEVMWQDRSVKNPSLVIRQDLNMPVLAALNDKIEAKSPVSIKGLETVEEKKVIESSLVSDEGEDAWNKLLQI